MTEITEAYFLAGPADAGDTGITWRTFTATERTGSPWGEGFQHGAPPAALVTHLLESVVPEGGRLARVTVDLLGAVPLGELRGTARVTHPGRRIALLEAVVTDPAGREVVRGAGWWVRHHDTTAVAPAVIPREQCTWADPEDPHSFTGMWASGYIDTLDSRTAPGQLWVRATVPVVAGVPDTPWTRLMGVADVANGTNPTLDPREWQFMNTDLTVNLHRLPRGEWICVKADANYGPDGIGLTAGRLHDEVGPVGTTTQALMLNPL